MGQLICNLGQCGTNLGLILKLRGSMTKHVGASWCNSRQTSCKNGDLNFIPSNIFFNICQVSVGLSWPMLDQVGGMLGLCWPKLARLGTILCDLGAMLKHTELVFQKSLKTCVTTMFLSLNINLSEIKREARFNCCACPLVSKSWLVLAAAASCCWLVLAGAGCAGWCCLFPYYVPY